MKSKVVRDGKRARVLNVPTTVLNKSGKEVRIPPFRELQIKFEVQEQLMSVALWLEVQKKDGLARIMLLSARSPADLDSRLVGCIADAWAALKLALNTDANLRPEKMRQVNKAVTILKLAWKKDIASWRPPELMESIEHVDNMRKASEVLSI